jgi:DNA polymerase-4
MDAFYVSVELRRRPELRGRPVVVGGAGPRGVVAAANYEARRYGVHSAMASARARRLCPHAVFLPGDHRLYAEVSEQVHALFHDVTPLVEGLALDEAFLDVTGARRTQGTGPEIGHRLRERIQQELDLTCSVGVAPNKFLAKMASVAAKPRAGRDGVRPGPGVVEIRPGEELAFLHPHPVSRLWGVGPATLARLERLGVVTIGDLAALGRDVLVRALGPAQGTHLHELSLGLDDRPVVPDRQAKSIGHEETFASDLYDRDEIRTEVVRLADAVAGRLRHHGVAARTLTLKVRSTAFVTTTRSVTPPEPVTTGPEILAALEPVLATLDASGGVRLLGVTGSNLVAPARQLTLDLGAPTGAPTASAVPAATVWRDAALAIDEIRERFGAAAIRPASTVRQRGRPGPGTRPWGPDAPGPPA